MALWRSSVWRPEGLECSLLILSLRVALPPADIISWIYWTVDGTLTSSRSTHALVEVSSEKLSRVAFSPPNTDIAHRSPE